MGLNSFLVCVEFTVLGMGKFGTWAVTKNFFGFSPEQGISRIRDFWACKPASWAVTLKLL